MNASHVEIDGAKRLESEEIFAALQDIISAGQSLTAALNGRFPTLDSHGLAPVALHAIHAAGRRGVSQTDLARELGRSPSATTRLVDHLQHDDLVSRQPHPSDRRVNLVTLTGKGQAMLADVAQVIGDRRGNRVEFDLATIARFREQLSRIASIADDILPSAMISSCTRI
jgi:DNA-binding MarR family transcriptional regulator